MKTASANPVLLDLINSWAMENPYGFLFGSAFLLMLACYFLKEWF